MKPSPQILTYPVSLPKQLIDALQALQDVHEADEIANLLLAMENGGLRIAVGDFYVLVFKRSAPRSL